MIGANGSFQKDEQEERTARQVQAGVDLASLRHMKTAPLSWQIAERIQEAVFRGEFRAGQHLRELNLAKQFRVSQATIREALSKVEQQGLVVRTPHHSTTVVQLLPEQLREIAAVRRTLERMAFLEAAERATGQDLDALANRNAKQGGEQPETPAAVADWEFHRQVWRLSGNTTLIRMLEQLTMPVIAFHAGCQKTVKPKAPVGDSHQELIIALRMRDREMIASALERHLADDSAAAQDVTGMMGASTRPHIPTVAPSSCES
jgi:DNA-binding GntR family transcriptional regulator